MLLRACTSLVLGAALLAGCAKARPTEQAASQVAAKQDKLQDEQNKLEQSRIQLLGHISHVATAASDLANAKGQFQARRDERAAALGARASVMSSEAMVIGVLAQGIPVAGPARVQVTRQVQALNMRLAEASQAIEKLGRSDATHYDELAAAASQAIDHAQSARRAAWHVLDTVPRQRASS